MTYFRRITYIFLISLFAMSISACGGGSSSGDDTGGDTGGDNGGDTGGDNGGDNGGDTGGGDTGGDNGGDTGGDNGGDTGGDTGGGSGSGQLADCFNEVLLTTGTSIMQSYNSTTSNGSASFTDNRTVTGQKQFNGETAIETDGTTETTVSNGTTSSARTQTYSQLNTGSSTFNTLGTVTMAAAEGFNVNSTSTFEPKRVDRYNLNAGDSYTQNYTITTESSVGSNTFTSTNQVKSTVTYLGNESVTVPAGTFDSCKVQDVEENTSGGSTTTFTTTNWYDVGSGLLLKVVAEDDESNDTTTTELVSGSVNGAAID